MELSKGAEVNSGFGAGFFADLWFAHFNNYFASGSQTATVSGSLMISIYNTEK